MIDCDSLETLVNYWEFRMYSEKFLVITCSKYVRSNGNHKIIITKIIIIHSTSLWKLLWESLKYKMIAYNIAVQKFWAVVVLLKFDWDYIGVCMCVFALWNENIYLNLSYFSFIL